MRSTRGAALLAAIFMAVTPAAGFAAASPHTTSDTGKTTASSGTRPVSPAPGAFTAPRFPTVVTLTFDDGWKNQAAAADMMAKHNMRGTFFINSGMTTFPGYLNRAQLVSIVAEGHEIGGHTSTHPMLRGMSLNQRRQEVCDDRTWLKGLGTPVTSFAYPYGFVDASLRSVVKECGYTTARGSGGLSNRSPADPLCDCVGRIPFRADRWAVPVKPTLQTADRLIKLKRWVMQGEQVGGWVPIVFTRICDACGPDSTSLSDFKAFVEWLDERPPTTSVKTFAQVVDRAPPGPRQPGAATAVAQGEMQEAVKGHAGTITPEVENTDYALTVDGIGIGQAQIVIFFLVVAVVLTVSYRVGTRHKRFVL